VNTTIMHILTRTPLHVGAGASVGTIDMPVQRERHSMTPIIPGSSIKGVMRDLFRDNKEQQKKLFGPEDPNEAHMGELVFSEAKTLFFPVRSAKSSFAWITSKMALCGYARERHKNLDLPDINDEGCISADGVVINDDSVVLEEYRFKKTGVIKEDVMALIKDIFQNDPVWKTLPSRMVILSDGNFSYFCANACEVQERIKIDDETGTVTRGGLFNQENVPANTFMYGIIGARTDISAIDALKNKINGNVVQFGGDETIGLGFCSVEII